MTFMKNFICRIMVGHSVAQAHTCEQRNNARCYCWL